MSSTERTEQEIKLRIQLGPRKLEIWGPPAKKPRRRTKTKLWDWLPSLALIVLVLVAWWSDAGAVLALLAVLDQVSGLVGKLRR